MSPILNSVGRHFNNIKYDSNFNCYVVIESIDPTYIEIINEDFRTYDDDDKVYT